MSRMWNSLSPRQQAAAKDAVDALLTIHTLTGPDDGMAAPRHGVTFRDLLAWVQGADARLSREVQNALATDRRLARDLETLLRRTAGWYGARAAAASSGGLDTREGNGFRLRLKSSRTGSGLVYVLIDFVGDPQPTTLSLYGGGTCVKIALPPAQDGIIQILAEEASEEIRLLRDPGSELFLW